MVSVASPPLGPDPSMDVNALLAVVAGDLTDDGVGDLLVALHRAEALVDAARVRVTGVFDARAVWARDGARNHEGWVTARTGAGYGAAKLDKALARDLRDMPLTAERFARGGLTLDQVRVLAKARVPELAAAFDACEEILVEQVAAMTVNAAVRFLRRWAAEVRERFGIGEPDGPEPASAGPTSQVHLSGVTDGRWRLDGNLTGEDGEIIRNVVDAQVDQMWRDGVFTTDDGLTASERFATALVEVLVRGSRGGDDDGTAKPLLVGIVPIDTDTCTCPHCQTDTPPPPGPPPDDPTGTSPPSGDSAAVPMWDDIIGDPDGDWFGADRPLIDDRTAFTVTPTGLEAGGRVPERLFGLGELEHAGLVHPRQVDRWLCEGTLQILHFHDDHDDLRLGRKVRIATRTQRRALRARDGGCVFPGCAVNASYCVAHHVTWWEWGGTSDLENLVLVCRFHHTAIHDRGFAMTRSPDGVVAVTRPDGTPLGETRHTRPDPTLRPIVPRRPREPADAEAALLHRTTRHRIDTLIAQARHARAGP